MKHPIRRRLLYTGFVVLRRILQWLPLAGVRALGRRLGDLAYLFLPAYRRLSLTHLEMVFGSEMPQADRRRIVRRMFQNLGQNAFEWLVMPRWTAKDLQAMIQVEGLEHIRAALQAGNGAVVITPHFGNWELGPVLMASLGFRGAVLARRLRYPEYESFLIGMRGDKGVPTLARGSLKEVAKMLRENHLVGLLPDQDMDSLEGIFVNFLGRPAYTLVGPSALSLMTSAPIIPTFIIRDGERFRFVIEPAVPFPPRSGDRRQDLAALTQAWSDVLERYIRQYPDHWVWMHRRWKTTPESRAAAAARSDAAGQVQPALAAMLIAMAACLGGLAGCSSSKPSEPVAAVESGSDQEISGFTLAGYQEDGSKSWEMEGREASADGSIVTIFDPDAIGYSPDRTAYLSADLAQVDQRDRHIRLEHDVTIHTSDGVWFTTPVLHWMPEKKQFGTDDPVRLETDHMLLRGRGAEGSTELKQTTVFRDIEMVLNPSEHETPGQTQHVTITCDGPLTMDYDRRIAIFENNVRVVDANGEMLSDRLIAYLNADSHTIRYAEALGRVTIHQGEHTAHSERAVYEPALGKITLLGKPSLLIESDPKGVPMSLGLSTPTAADLPPTR